MLREKKTEIVAKLADTLSRSTIVIATSYQGLSAKGMAELRGALGGGGAECHVVKNTLVRLAGERASKAQVMDIIDGPTALVFGYDDAGQAARTLDRYIKSSEFVVIKGGLVGERVLSGQEVMALANLPSREMLLSQLVAQLQSPMVRLHNVLSSPLRGLQNALQSRIQALTA
ncbi:MAG: 50S ribosomal protein L10 [Dehalococcoidia bacterium]|nr:50S ribosomal protein L10 [Dehalococcoidia bacterium]